MINLPEMTTLLLISSDNQKIEIDSESAKKSNLLLTYLNDEANKQETIQLSEVKYDILKKIVEYLTYYKDKTPKEIPKPMPSSNLNEVLDEWDVKFINSLELESVFELINAANYMEIQSLLDLACSKISSMMKGKSIAEIKSMFNIECDLTDEELREYEEYQI